MKFCTNAVYPQLCENLNLMKDLKASDINSFLLYLENVVEHGTPFINKCVDIFLCKNKYKTQPSSVVERKELEELVSIIDNHPSGENILEFASTIKYFFNEIYHISNVDIYTEKENTSLSMSTPRMVAYIRHVGLFKERSKNILCVCASSRMHPFLLHIWGHNVINTDLGSLNHGWQEMKGAKCFIRDNFLGHKVINFAVNNKDFSSIFDVSWFEKGIDVLSLHGVNPQIGWAQKKFFFKVKDDPVQRALIFLDPILRSLKKTSGTLDMRHCSLFVGYDPAIREKLCTNLKGELHSFGANVLLCGVDPFPNPWGYLTDGKAQWSDHALVLNF